jgi:hypothetical protein
VVAVQDWLTGFAESDLELLSSCAAKQLALGNEWVNVIYDVDDEPDIEPFVGVAMIPQFRDSRVVLTRSEFDQLLLRVLGAIEESPPEPSPLWWDSFRKNAKVLRDRVERG